MCHSCGLGFGREGGAGGWGKRRTCGTWYGVLEVQRVCVCVRARARENAHVALCALPATGIGTSPAKKVTSQWGVSCAIVVPLGM